MRAVSRTIRVVSGASVDVVSGASDLAVIVPAIRAAREADSIARDGYGDDHRVGDVLRSSVAAAVRILDARPDLVPGDLAAAVALAKSRFGSPPASTESFGACGAAGSADIEAIDHILAISPSAPADGLAARASLVAGLAAVAGVGVLLRVSDLVLAAMARTPGASASTSDAIDVRVIAFT